MGSTFIDDTQLSQKMVLREALSVQIALLKVRAEPLKSTVKFIFAYIQLSRRLNKYFRHFPLDEWLETRPDERSISLFYDAEKEIAEQLDLLSDQLNVSSPPHFLQPIFKKIRDGFSVYADEFDRRVEEMEWARDLQVDAALNDLVAVAGRAVKHFPDWRDSMGFIQ